MLLKKYEIKNSQRKTILGLIINFEKEVKFIIEQGKQKKVM
jgi:hypothetical protein